MTTSQSDVDKVMAAFGAAPIKYRPNQDAAGELGGKSATAPTAGQGVAVSAPSAHAEERILPGAGGRVREIFPLLWRAIPIAGELKVGAIKRPGDEVAERADPDTLADRFPPAAAQPGLAEAHDESPQQQAPSLASAAVPRVVPFVAADAKPAAPFAAETAARAISGARSARPLPGGRAESPADPAASPDLTPAQWAQQAQALPTAAPPAPVTAVPATPLPPLRPHAELIKAIAQRASGPAAAQAAATQTAAAGPPTAAQPAASQPVLAAPPPAPAAAYPAPPPPPPAQSSPSYYAAPPMPPQGMQPYPVHPGAGGWSQPGYPPPYPQLYPPPYAPPYPPPYAPLYPSPGAGYPPNYPPAYPPPYPYGYPQQPASSAHPEAYGGGYAPGYPPGDRAPEQPMAASPQAAQMPEQADIAPPEPPAGASPQAPATLSDIFAALHRAPGAGHGEETPQ